MPIEITMPRLSDTMQSGTILKWNVTEGEKVSSGQVVADIETDKATMELSVYDDGTLAKILVPEGQAVDVGSVIALLAEPGEDASSLPAGAARRGGDATRAAGRTGDSEGAGGGAATATMETPRKERPSAPGRPASAGAGSGAGAGAGDASKHDRAADEGAGGRQRVSPVARRLAEEHGLDLAHIAGSGPSGRIIKRDILAAVDAAQETQAAVPPSAALARSGSAPGAGVVQALAVASGGTTKVPLSGMRQTIARRLVESKQTMPHYEVAMTFAVDELLGLRADLNRRLDGSGIRLSLNDFIVRACALAMAHHPQVNASWGGDHILVHGDVNVGVAIALPPERGGGLVVGVVRQVDRKSLRTISEEAKSLAEKARTRGLSMDEMSGSTFTISNLGMYGVDHFTAIINPPNAAILAVGAAIERPVVRDGAVVPGHEMTVTLCSDHRIVDGAMAAAYLQSVRELVESPALLLV